MKTSKKETAQKPVAKVERFTAQDICAIIKECGLSGVREFNYLGLELRYGPLPPAQAIEPIHVPYEIQKAQDSQARDSFQNAEQKIKEELIDNLLIEDPVAYEQLMREEELIDGDDLDGQEQEEN